MRFTKFIISRLTKPRNITFGTFRCYSKRSELRKGPRKCDVDSLLLQTLLRCDKNIHIISVDLILSDQITVIRLSIIYYFFSSCENINYYLLITPFMCQDCAAKENVDVAEEFALYFRTSVNRVIMEENCWILQKLYLSLWKFSILVCTNDWWNFQCSKRNLFMQKIDFEQYLCCETYMELVSKCKRN